MRSDMLILATVATAAAVWSIQGTAAVPETVDEVIIDRYLGQWYSVYTTPFSAQYYEPNSTCNSATYGVLGNNSITVYNGGRLFEPTGELDCIDGYAYATNESGKFKVSLNSVPADGDYWIVQLGDLEGEYPYFYVVVTDPQMTTLFIMTRDVVRFEAEGYKQALYDWAVSEGYDIPGFNLPLEVLHTPECIYPPVPAENCPITSPDDI